MNEHVDFDKIEVRVARPSEKVRAFLRTRKTIALVVILAIGATYYYMRAGGAPRAAVRPPPSVTVSPPIARDIERTLGFLGQFSAVNRVELRAQVGGELTRIHFRDGAIVEKGDVLFEVDPEPYKIKLSLAQAELTSAKARLALATRELSRAQELQRAEAGSVQNVDEKVAEHRVAQAAVDHAVAQVRDAKFDLERTKVRAPFTGRMGTHLVSIGNLISGSRAGSGPSTLLATIVSLDPIYIDFDMSENDYAAFQHEHLGRTGPLSNQVILAPTGDDTFSRQATLEFLDHSLDRSSGTIHARAIVPNGDLSLTPGGFARIRLVVSNPESALLVPDAAVLADLSDHIVYVVGNDNLVSPRKVEIGDLRGGLRVIRAGLSLHDQVIINGIPTVHAGAKVRAQAGTIQYSSEAEHVALGASK
ncbi:efflux RND transporter periplasmic adaptor subunit [Cupriavidus gilardii]|uniref:efflux RND transporter periplasmic adaptor subunit n=1 Tax=Cupriavidus gilardii TaxID=82541 RepID=UPI0007E443FB|nr:efflux RND transporter periplasmic adaptor subunit [Cupriavidus gilardii]